MTLHLPLPVSCVSQNSQCNSGVPTKEIGAQVAVLGKIGGTDGNRILLTTGGYETNGHTVLLCSYIAESRFEHGFPARRQNPRTAVGISHLFLKIYKITTELSLTSYLPRKIIHLPSVNWAIWLNLVLERLKSWMIMMMPWTAARSVLIYMKATKPFLLGCTAFECEEYCDFARLTVRPMSAAKSETWHACPIDIRIINLLLETSRRSLLPSPGDNHQR